MRRQRGSMSLDLFKAIIDDVAANGHVIDWLHGFGEPLLWPHLVDGIEYMTSRGVTAGLSTNGALLTPHLAARLFAAGQRTILVALDTVDPSAYAKIRAGLDWFQVVENVRACAAAVPGLTLELQSMPTRFNPSETVADILKPFVGPDGRAPNNVIPRQWFCVRLSDTNVTRNMHHAPLDIPPSLCDKLNERVCILWDGRTSLCCLDAECELPTGHLPRNTIASSFSGPWASFWRHAILSGSTPPTCSRCFKDHVVLHRLSSA